MGKSRFREYLDLPSPISYNLCQRGVKNENPLHSSRRGIFDWVKNEQQITGINIWLPAKDKDIDPLVTNSQNRCLVSLQVKFSRDFLVTHMESMFQEGLLACGWCTHSRKKIRASQANLWVFVLHAFDPPKTQFILIPPPRSLTDAFPESTAPEAGCNPT
jgi:hypothetical protein